MSRASDNESDGDSDDEFSDCSASEGSESGYEEIDVLDEFSNLIGERTVSGNTGSSPRKSDPGQKAQRNTEVEIKPNDQNTSNVRKALESELEPKVTNNTDIIDWKSSSASKGPNVVKKTESFIERSVYLKEILQRNRSVVNQKKEELSQKNLLGILSRKHNGARDYSVRSATYKATIDPLETSTSDAVSYARKFETDVDTEADTDLLKAFHEASGSCHTPTKHAGRRKITYECDPAYTCTHPAKKDIGDSSDEIDGDKASKRSSRSRRNVGKVSYVEFESDNDSDDQQNFLYRAVSSFKHKTQVPKTNSDTLPKDETEDRLAGDTLEDVKYKTGQYICQKCNNRYGNLYSLAKHMRSHTEENEEFGSVVPKIEIDDHSNEIVNQKVEHTAGNQKNANETEKHETANPNRLMEVKQEPSENQKSSAVLIENNGAKNSVEVEHGFIKDKGMSCGVSIKKPAPTKTFNALTEVVSYRTKRIAQNSVEVKHKSSISSGLINEKPSHTKTSILTEACGMKTESLSVKQGSNAMSKTATNRLENGNRTSASEPEDVANSDSGDKNEQQFGPVFKCAVCNKSFDELGKLEKHVVSHIPQDVFSCGFCPKQFSSADTLLIHMSAHDHGTNPKTVATLKAYLKEKKSPSNLTINSPSNVTMKRSYINSSKSAKRPPDNVNGNRTSASEPEDVANSDSGDKNEQQFGPVFICAVCNKSFDELGKLEKHVVSHIPQDVFSCGFCPKQFSSADTLLIHMSAHDHGTNPKTVAALKAYLKEKKSPSNLTINSPSNVTMKRSYINSSKSAKRPPDNVITLSDSNEDYDADSDETEVIQFDKSTGKKRTFKKGKSEVRKRQKTDNVVNTSSENMKQKSESMKQKSETMKQKSEPKKRFKSYLRETHSEPLKQKSEPKKSFKSYLRETQSEPLKEKSETKKSFKSYLRETQSEPLKQKSEPKKSFKSYLRETHPDADVVIVDSDTNASSGSIKRKSEGERNNVTKANTNGNTSQKGVKGKPENKMNNVKKPEADNDVVIVDVDSSVEPEVIIIDDVEESDQKKKVPKTDPNAISKLLNYKPKVTFT